MENIETRCIESDGWTARQDQQMPTCFSSSFLDYLCFEHPNSQYHTPGWWRYDIPLDFKKQLQGGINFTPNDTEEVKVDVRHQVTELLQEERVKLSDSYDCTPFGKTERNDRLLCVKKEDRITIVKGGHDKENLYAQTGYTVCSRIAKRLSRSGIGKKRRHLGVSGGRFSFRNEEVDFHLILIWLYCVYVLLYRNISRQHVMLLT